MGFWIGVVALLLPSVPVVERYLGAGAAIVYLAVAGMALGALRRWGAPWLARQSERTVGVLTLGLLLGLAALLVVGYPLANNGRLGGGTDRDDALLVAGRALLDGRYPYDETTYLGNPITPLPGALMLALPFAALGLIVLQNWIWPAIFLAASGRLLGDRRRGLLVWLTLLGLAPVALNELLVGGDLLVNSLYLWLGSAWLLARLRENRPVWPAALLLGVLLASRVNFWVLGAIVVAAGARERSWGRMGRTALLIGVATAGMTLPFYLAAPDRFSPLHTVGELWALDAVWPGASLLVGLFTVGVTCAAAWGVWRGRWGWTAAGAAALAAPVLLAALLGLLLGVDGWLGYLRFGAAYLPWAAVGLWRGGDVPVAGKGSLPGKATLSGKASLAPTGRG